MILMNYDLHKIGHYEKIKKRNNNAEKCQMGVYSEQSFEAFVASFLKLETPKIHSLSSSNGSFVTCFKTLKATSSNHYENSFGQVGNASAVNRKFRVRFPIFQDKSLNSLILCLLRLIRKKDEPRI